MAGAPVLPIDIAQILAHPQLAKLSASSIGLLLRAIALSWQQPEPCSLPNDEAWLRSALSCNNQYEWQRFWPVLCSWWHPFGTVRICKPLRRAYESSRRSLVNQSSMLSFPGSYDESYFALVKEPSVSSSVNSTIEQEDNNKKNQLETAEVKGRVREGAGGKEEPSRNPSLPTVSVSSISLTAPDWMWPIVKKEGMVGPRTALSELRRSKLRLLFEEHLLPLHKDEGKDPLELFRNICSVVKSRPWWCDDPSRWEPNYCFNNPVNRERHVNYALGIGPEYEHDTANKSARANGKMAGAPNAARNGRNGSSRYDQYAQRNTDST